MSATRTESAGAIGIDLGTTNSALAWTDGRSAVRVFDVPQLVAPGEIGRHPTLPSFLYIPTLQEIQSGLVPEGWLDDAEAAVAGVYARDHGSLTPGRQVSSAKSWLANPSVDRRVRLLPWGFDEGPRLSPVDASARILRHLRTAWDLEHARDERLAIDRHAIVLTVPASFDEEARELTIEAARAAGFHDLRLLEEPLAALYAWIAAEGRRGMARIGDGELLLVCDVGGGTADFSVMRARIEDAELVFERIAIGEHLLLGGDNLDLALASMMERTLTGNGSPKLTLAQRQSLRRKSSRAKEMLLGSDPPASVRITVPGAGRGLVAGGLSADLSRDRVIETLTDGFLPLTSLQDAPARDRRTGLRELGLPYESDPAITRHLAAFLTRAARATTGGEVLRPDRVLFNGGFFTPAVARERVVDALERWFGTRPAELVNARPEAAVAVGAAFYGHLRRHPQAAGRLLIRAGSARGYYMGLEPGRRDQPPAAVCIMPRGTQEGSTLRLDREFSVVANQPSAFTLYSSTQRQDSPGAIVTFSEADAAHRHAPLVTAFRYGQRSRRVPLSVRLRTVFAETGSLELWCESTTTDHRWRLSFNLRSMEADPLAGMSVEEAQAAPDHVVIDPERVDAARQQIRVVFSSGPGAPGALVGELENALGHGRQSWPLSVIRGMADALIEVEPGRRRAPAFESRWLNLTGFCMRPGFGSRLDEWRVSELRKVYAAGLAFPRDIQCQVEWLVLWQRVSGGLGAGQQRELAQRVCGQLGLGQRKAPRLNAQVEREGWRLLGSLERLDGAFRVRLGDEIVQKVRREPRNPSWAWTVARLGAREPVYGPLNAVVPPPVAARWIEQLLDAKQITRDIADAIVQIGALVDDPARDIPEALRDRARAALEERGIPRDMATPLTRYVTKSRADVGRALGETLPEGLRLDPVQPVA